MATRPESEFRFGNYDTNLAPPETREIAQGLKPPLFTESGLLLAGNLSPYLIGSSPLGFVHWDSPSAIETWTQSPNPRSSTTIMLPDGRCASSAFLENMYVQFSEGIPGVVLDPVNEKIWIDTKAINESVAQTVYEDWLAIFPEDSSQRLSGARAKQILDKYAISPGFAFGLYHLRDTRVGLQAAAVKGQQTGLISWGLQVQDQDGRPIIYNEEVFDIVARALLLKALWQHQQLVGINPNVIIHLDEPYLTQIGSAHIAIPDPQATLHLEFGAMADLNLGAHCCGQTRYEMLLGNPNLKIAALDLTGENWDGCWETASFAHAFVTSSPYANVSEFLGRGGHLALGIVPYNPQIGAEQVRDHALQIVDELRKRGIEVPLAQLLLTPTCGAGSEPPEVAQHAFTTLITVAKRLQEELSL